MYELVSGRFMNKMIIDCVGKSFISGLLLIVFTCLPVVVAMLAAFRA